MTNNNQEQQAADIRYSRIFFAGLAGLSINEVLSLSDDDFDALSKGYYSHSGRQTVPLHRIANAIEGRASTGTKPTPLTNNQIGTALLAALAKCGVSIDQMVDLNDLTSPGSYFVAGALDLEVFAATVRETILGEVA